MTAFPGGLRAALEGRYEIERELGRGGMATVYLARDLRHGRPVALKLLNPELAAWIGRDRFLREIRLTASFDHPHILPVLDSGVDDDGRALWYTMPFVRGESLRDRLTREGPLPLQEAMRLTAEIADALSYAHRRGIVHRDIKPENILLSEGHARVADFGIARAAGGAEEAGPRLTGTGLIIGTPAYMSPEQSAGGEVDNRSDIYALACVTFEMLAGEPPHGGPTPQAMIARRYQDPYPALAPRRPGLPAGIEPVLHRALAVEPADRFADARDFASALAAAAAGAASATSGPRGIHRRRLGGIAAGTVAALVIAALAITVLREQRDAPQDHAIMVAPIRLAVLPFTNLGDSSREYLTDGLVDAIRGRLAALPSLEVISSGSTEQYRHPSKSLQQIGRELDVPYVVIGKVRWIGTSHERHMQVSPELVQVPTGATKWQDAIDAGMAQTPALPGDIAQAIVHALGVAVSPRAQGTLTDTATRDPEAYDLYLRASDIIHRIGVYQAPTALLPTAMDMLRQAIALDPRFDLAKVRLANAFRYTADISGGDSAGYAAADSLLRAVLARRPAMAEAIEAHGRLRQDRGDLKGALRLLQEAATLEPSNANIQGEITFLQSLLLDSTALVTGARAVALAPRDADMLRRVIQGTSIFRNAEQLERYSDRLIELEPSDPNGYLHKAFTRLWTGDTAGALAALRRSEAALGGLPEIVAWVYTMCGPPGWQRWHTFRLGDLVSPEGRDTIEYYWYQGQIAAAEGRSEVERAYADSVLRHTRLVKATDLFHALALTQAAWAHAVRRDGEGRRTLSAAEEATDRQPLSFKVFFQNVFVPAHMALGDTAAALTAARLLLERPSEYTRSVVALAPEFASLRGVPAFREILSDTTLP